ncbi:hypothetical protein NDU88_000899 [Pleurodeles waltl]|uniref:Uncharacterized protein n=1 Tax=Pleurodeles waltl TaxID=8319 RepID=A0AAV7NE70_PLEWA|nr:hypothetical protein NDU88_000899 [Pleurodeles waltl]
MSSAEEKVKEAMRLLAEAVRLDLVVSGAAWPRPTRRASRGVAAAVIACSPLRTLKREQENQGVAGATREYKERPGPKVCRAGWGRAAEYKRPAVWMEVRVLQEVVGMSGTRSLGEDRGKEVPKGRNGVEAPRCMFEDMQLDYVEDSPEEGEIVEGESDKEERQGQEERGVQLMLFVVVSCRARQGNSSQPQRGWPHGHWQGGKIWDGHRPPHQGPFVEIRYEAILVGDYGLCSEDA